MAVPLPTAATIRPQCVRVNRTHPKQPQVTSARMKIRDDPTSHVAESVVPKIVLVLIVFGCFPLGLSAQGYETAHGDPLTPVVFALAIILAVAKLAGHLAV